MLPEPARLRRRVEFDEVVRGGARAGRPTLVVHLLRDGDAEPRAGFIVSKQVGTSVRRHRVTRQLRHLMADRLGTLPAGTRVVVRARPESAGRTAVDLGTDLDRAFARLIGGSR
jgi:ribonuclease P protein component